MHEPSGGDGQQFLVFGKDGFHKEVHMAPAPVSDSQAHIDSIQTLRSKWSDLLEHWFARVERRPRPSVLVLIGVQDRLCQIATPAPTISAENATHCARVDVSDDPFGSDTHRYLSMVPRGSSTSSMRTKMCASTRKDSGRTPQWHQ